MSRQEFTAAAVLTLGMSVWSPAAAGETAGADEFNGSDLSEIVVTATRRAETIQDIPFSVTAYSGRELEARSIQNLADFVEEVPGVMLVNYGAGANEITIRGLNANATQVGSYQSTTVGYYLNDMPLSENPQAAADIPFFDLQRVEVLRGPQGTLFGEGAPGGLIRYIVNEPNLNKLEGAVNVQGSHYDGGSSNYDGDGAVNLPVIEGQLAVRLVAGYRRDGGFFNDYVGPTLSNVIKDANSSNTQDARVLIKWQPVDALDVNFNFFEQVLNGLESNQFASSTGVKYAGIENNSWSKFDISNITVDWRLPVATVTSSTNYLRQRDYVFFALPIYSTFVQTQAQDESIRNFIEEIRAVSSSAGPFRWVFGAFYKDRSRNTGLPLNQVDLSGETPTFPYFTIDDIRNDKEYALYGEAEYDLTKLVTFVVGGRWTRQDSRYTTAQVNLAPEIFPFPTYTDVGTTSYSIFTPKGSVLFHWNEQLTSYFTYAEGFRGPGTNNFYSTLTATYGAEKVKSYEVGTKASLLDNRIFLTSAVYYNDWIDMQVPLNLDSPWQSTIVNSGKAWTKGVEFEARVALTRHWEVGGSTAFSESKLLNFVAYPQLDGNQLPRDPKWTGSVFADAQYAIGDGFKFHGRADWLYIGHRYDNIFNTVPDLSAYRVINGRMGIEKDGWEAYLFGRNLGNEFVTYTGNPSQGYSIMAPRTIGLGATYRF